MSIRLSEGTTVSFGGSDLKATSIDFRVDGQRVDVTELAKARMEHELAHRQIEVIVESSGRGANVPGNTLGAIIISWAGSVAEPIALPDFILADLSVSAAPAGRIGRTMTFIPGYVA